jgi:hypothetical protein
MPETTPQTVPMSSLVEAALSSVERTLEAQQSMQAGGPGTLTRRSRPDGERSIAVA